MVENPFASVGQDIIGTVFSSVIWLGVGLIVAIALGSVIYYQFAYKRKFDIFVRIRSERAGDPSIVEGKAAILNDRSTGTKFFKILAGSIKKELPVPPYNVIQRTNKGDMIELWRKSEEEFIFLLPGTIDKTYIVRQDGKQYHLAQLKQKQVEGDISYWNVKRKKENKSMFSQDSLLMKLLPFIPQIIGGFFIIFILYILVDSLPGILTELRALTAELRNLKGSATVTPAVFPLIFLKWTGKY